ncbi:hypothetical protein B9Z45_15000 [Limnohabitans sp. 2KL-17]|uniref:DUF2946 family protein n=1 Tax=Limnohabitans sp. 2KL-17 TaxID=1100704 RepID=UPI000D386F1B|nr:DUF2946 family protein [Limnohabitans sp. 2KL-17]PUE51108.1 hypothetical protein B9Z45_15000 [Limnohabitans sp. 2KL-17]
MNFARIRWPIWQIGLLVWALLWAPVWGQWHGIVHSAELALSAPAGLHAGHTHEENDAHEEDDAHEENDADHSGHSAGSDLCRVLDHLAHADSLNAPLLAWSAPMLSVQAPVFWAAFLRGHDRWSLAQARAPPALI